MDMNTIIEKFVQLNALKAELHRELDAKIKAAWKRWTKCEFELCKAKGIHWGYGHPGEKATIDNWSYSGNGEIFIQWREYWCDEEDSGGDTIPLAYILNENGEQDAYDIANKAACTAAEADRHEKERDEAIRNLEAAKAKLDAMK